MRRRIRFGLALLAIVSFAGCLRGSGVVKPGSDRDRGATGGLTDAGDNNGGPGADGGDTLRDSGTPVEDAAVPDSGEGPSDMGMPDGSSTDMGGPDIPFVPGMCGNGVVEYGETCDDCALDCDDGNACTADEVGGSAQDCLAYCRNQPFFDCTGGDGCCPSGCTSANDPDCSSTCGDGVIDADETCDPGDTCPVDCDDGDPSTRDIMTGSAQNCNVVCTHVPIRRCLNGDGYCPAGCTNGFDDDCASTCGNGIIEVGETCDPPGSCPKCDDQNSCTENITSGTAATCDVSCSHPPITACVSGDGCCADGCTNAEDADCSATCGDRVVEAPETCDGPSQCNSLPCDQGGACTTTSRTGRHQNCNVQCAYTEIYGCQDGDGCCGEGCTAANDNDCDAECGNGVIEPGEVCDPPEMCETSCLDDNDVCTTTEYLGDPATCDGRCEHRPITACGSADGCCPASCNANNDPDCDAMCGNGVTEPGEVCDGNCPNCNDGVACTTDVTLGSAGTCDQICQHIAITQCINGDGCCAPGCNANTDTDCAPICGNAVVESGETCDGNCPISCNDGNTCTTDSGTGSAATCDLSCRYTTITACTSGDLCCPAGCTVFNDTDCP